MDADASANAVSQNCTATAISTESYVLLPRHYANVRVQLEQASQPLHRCRSFIAQPLLRSEIRVQTEIEADLRPSVGVIRAIPRALISPEWDEDLQAATSILRVENRGTELMSVRKGHALAQLEELSLNSKAESEIISLED